LHSCTLLVPKVAFDEHGLFDTRLRTTQDYDLWFRMATTLRFIHHPEILVEARSHENQGTLRMSELVLQECNELLGNFVEKLSETEVCSGSGCSLPLGYIALSHSFRKRGFTHAGVRAAKLARNALADMFTAPEEPSRVSAFLEELIRMMDQRGMSPLETEPRQPGENQTNIRRMKEALKQHFPAIVPLLRHLRFLWRRRSQ
jgi:hypothetical protein